MQGEQFLDSLDDICSESVVLIDGMDVWETGEKFSPTSATYDDDGLHWRLDRGI